MEGVQYENDGNDVTVLNYFFFGSIKMSFIRQGISEIRENLIFSAHPGQYQLLSTAEHDGWGNFIPRHMVEIH